MRFTILVVGVAALLFTLTVDVAHSQAEFFAAGDPRETDTDPDHYKNVFNANTNNGGDKVEFMCPGIGNFAVKKPSKESCKNYYVCPVANQKAVSLQICGSSKLFHRLSRTCVEKEYVKCKWCSKEGRYADVTSKNNFIECVPGSVAIRYKCKEGDFDARKKECIERDWKITDLTVDVVADPPKDIIKFQKKWNSNEMDANARSIEELSSGRKEKKEKKKSSIEETTKSLKKD